MRTSKRPSGREWSLLLSALVLGLAFISTSSFADDPIETQIAPLVGSILEQINAVTCPIRSDSTIGCPGPIDPCNYAPCSVTPRQSNDLVAVQTAIAIGKFQPNAVISLGDAGAVPTLLAFCQHYLLTFIGDTQHLGPLLDYGACLESGSVPAVLATLPQVNTGGITFLAGVCTLVTRAYEDIVYVPSPYYYGPSVNFTGTTDCTAGTNYSSNTFAADVSVRPVLENVLYAEQILVPATGYGLNYAERAASLNSSLSGRVNGGIAMVNLITSIAPRASACSGSSVCTTSWVVLPDKNPDTGTSLTCNTSGDVLTCQSHSIPLTDSTIAQK